jgi:hypothetical protein
VNLYQTSYIVPVQVAVGVAAFDVARSNVPAVFEQAAPGVSVIALEHSSFVGPFWTQTSNVHEVDGITVAVAVV